MGQDWIIDVLTDLRVFAGTNDMPKLGAQLDLALSTARDEIVATSVHNAQRPHLDPTCQEIAGRK